MSDDTVLTSAALGDTDALLNSHADECGLRKLVVPSPGSKTNYAVLRDGVEAGNTIGYMHNTGRCKLFLNALDSNGRVIMDPARGEQQMLAPGQVLEGWSPPPGTAKVVVAAASNCTDYAELEWDPCAYYA